MSIVKLDGLKLKGKEEVQPSKLIPSMGTVFKQHGNRKEKKDKYIVSPPLLNDSFYRPASSMVQGCKPEPFSHIRVIRPPPIPQTNNMVPKTGYAKHQKKGLAYDKFYGPISAPNPPITNFFNVNITKRAPF